MPFQVSPGVNVSEVDLTTTVPAISTTEGAFAGNFSKGPVNQRVLIDSEDRLVKVFGEPNNENYEDWFSAANFLSYGNALYVVRVAGAGALNAVDAGGTAALIENKDDLDQNHTTAFAKFAARSPGAYGNSLKVSVCANAIQFSGTTQNTSLIAGVIVNGSNNFIVNATVADVNNILSVGDVISIGASTQERTIRTIAASGTTVTIAGTTINATRVTVTESFTAGVVADGIIKIRVNAWEYASHFNRAPGSTPYATKRGASGDAIHVIVIDEDGEITGERGTLLETFSNLSLASDAKTEDGATNYFGNVINEQSGYVWFGGTALEAAGSGSSTSTVKTFGTTSGDAESVSLASGANGSAPTAAQKIIGYDFFKSADDVDVSLVIAGEADATLANHIIDNIADYRKDCIVCISPEKSDVVNTNTPLDNVLAFRNSLNSSKYAVIDSGWKYQYDKYNDTYRYVPLNADTAGMMVITDLTRDPWFSPAGYNRGNVKNVVKLAWNPNQTDRDQLYKSEVNSIVSFPGQGTFLYGDKIMTDQPSAFDRINVRRLFIVLEKAIATAAKFTLFEFNDEFTRANFRNLVEPFLRDVQGRRGLGNFKVVCDGSNNSGEVIDRNEFVGDIYIVPARAINYVQLNFSAVRTGVEFTEIVGRGTSI